MFHLTIRTPYDDIFSGDVNSLTFDSESGQVQILENHASITISIAFSPVQVEAPDFEENFFGRSGLFLFDNETNSGVLLFNHCEKKSEISFQSIKDYAEFITKQLEEGHELSEFQLLFLKNEKVAVEKQMEELGE